MATTIGFRRTADWGHGLVGYVALRPEQALAGWTMVFEADFDIVNIWGAEIVARAPGRYLLRSVDWTAQVAASGAVEFGFVALNATPQPDPSGFVLGPPGIVRIETPRGPPALSLADATGAENAGFLVFVATLSHASDSPVTFRFTTEAGTARARSDFAALTGALTFAPGQTRQDIRIALTNDATVESIERFTLRITEAVGATLADPVAVGTIIDDDAPRITIADAALLEGDSGTALMRFTLTLSHAVNTSVGVKFSTADGSALAGTDYIARTGGVTFAAGETEKVVTIAVRGDRLVEADETFFLRLSDPVRGVITDAEALGTIRNNDLPRLSIADAAPVTETDAGGGALVGALSTRGNQIIDATGAAVRIAAVNWFGMETATMAPHGLHLRNWKDMMAQMAEQGFNAIRLPFSAEAIQENGQPNGINFALNPDLAGLSSLQIMDRIVEQAGTLGLRILLDQHRSFAGDGPNSNGLWYDGRFTEARWIDMWEDLAARYRGNPTVIGADVSNEPFGALWNQWAGAAERAGNAILAVNPDWLIVVEGVAVHSGEYYWWGGNLMGARDRPVVLNAPDKLVYSPHDYPNSVHPQPYFSAPDFPANLPGLIDRMWGYLWSEGIAPVLLGEWGSRLTQPKDLAWFDVITSYLQGDIDNNGTVDRAGIGPSFAWWSWNPNSGDTGGILADDWRTVLTQKVAALQPLLPDAAQPVRRALFEVTLDAAATTVVTVGWRTLTDSAGAESAGEADYVAATGTLRFAPGEVRKTVEVLIRADDVAEGTERFAVELFAPSGAAIADNRGVGQIFDDDAPVARFAADWVL